MKNKLLIIGCVILLFLMVGCVSHDEYNGKFKNDDEVAAYVNTLLQERYGKYFDNLDLFCCDYGTDDGVFHATVYATDERYEFGAKYDIQKNLLTTDASLEWHKDKMRKNISRMITTTMGSDKFAKDQYYLEIHCDYAPGFIEDYEEFVANNGTTIELMLHFDNAISDDDAVRVQALMKQLSDNHFTGTIQCMNGDYCGAELVLGKEYKIEDIKKCE